MDDTRNVTKDGEENVDTEVGTATTLGEMLVKTPSNEGNYGRRTSRNTPRGGRMTARMILQISEAVKGMLTVGLVCLW